MFGFNADGFKEMNLIKINPYRPILRQLISGGLSTHILNIGCFLLQTTIFPYRIGNKQKTRYRPISLVDSADI